MRNPVVAAALSPAVNHEAPEPGTFPVSGARAPSAGPARSRLFRLLRAAGLAVGMLAAPAVLHAQSDAPRTLSVQGVTAYDGQDLLSYAAKVAATRHGRVEAAEVAEVIELIYREDGHFLAVATVAPGGGSILVDEGRIDAVSIEGVDRETFRLLKSYMAPVVGKEAITLAEFERAIMLADDLPEISVTAEVDYPPGADGGVLRLVAAPEARQMGRITLDNPALQFGEAATLSFEQSFFGALTPGDDLRVGLFGTRAFDSGDHSLLGSLTYRFPIGGSGAYLEGYAGNIRAGRDARGALLETDVEGRTGILALGYPVIRDVERYGYAILEARTASTDVTVSGTVFESGVNAVGATWLYGEVTDRSGTVEYGVNLTFGETTAGGGPGIDDTFWHLRAGVGYEVPVRSFGPGGYVKAQVWGQFTGSRLPPVEEFYLGGREDERGYAFAEAQGDSGLSASVEIGRDFFPDQSAVQRLRPFAFLDAGVIANNDPTATELGDATLASIGLGVDAEFASNVFLRSHVGVPVTDGPVTNAGDPAFYLSVTKSW